MKKFPPKSSSYRLEYRSYRRPFQKPLATHHGLWRERHSLLICLTDPTGLQGFGEIAPISGLGSETLDQAFQHCQTLAPWITWDDIQAVPGQLPATRFGLESAWLDLTQYQQAISTPIQIQMCGLLPTGREALDAWPQLWQQGYQTFKWKLGVAPDPWEQEWCQELLNQLPDLSYLRLDANGSFTLNQALNWLNILDHPQVEFLEQPLPASARNDLLWLQDQTPIPLALDESVTTLQQIQAFVTAGWRGLFVIKPALVGSPSDLIHFCQRTPLEGILSSAFETIIGRYHALQLLRQLPHCQSRALGFGVNHFFQPDAYPDPFEHPLLPFQPHFKTLWHSHAPS